MKPDLTPSNLAQLIASGESKCLEFKANVPPDHAIAKHLVAFANTEGGTVLFGIGDKGTVLGIAESKVASEISRLKRLASSLLPEPAEIGVIEYEGKPLIYLTLEAAPNAFKPLMTAHGEIFTRHSARIIENKLAEQLIIPAELQTKKGHLPDIIVFVAMSFREEEEPALVDYYGAMQRAAEKVSSELRLKRIDLVEGDYEISQKIMDEIDRCQILIANFTLSPRNVYFEVGYCRGRRNIHIVQTARKDTSLEFDVRNWRTHFYKNATELEAKLVGALQEAVKAVRGT